MSALPDLRIVKTAAGQMEALVLKARLEAEDIPVHLSYESTASIYGFVSTGLGQVHVMVPPDFEAAARHILGAGEKVPPPEEEDTDGRVA